MWEENVIGDECRSVGDENVRMQHDDENFHTLTVSPANAVSYRSMQHLVSFPMFVRKSVFHFVVKSEKRSYWVSLIAVNVCEG